MLMKHIFICAILRFYQFIKNSYYIITYIIFKQFEKSKSPKNKTQYGFNRLMELHNFCSTILVKDLASMKPKFIPEIKRSLSAYFSKFTKIILGNMLLAILVILIWTIPQPNAETDILITTFTGIDKTIQLSKLTVLSTISDYYKAKAYMNTIAVAISSFIWPLSMVLILMFIWAKSLYPSTRTKLLLFVVLTSKISLLTCFTEAILTYSTFLDVKHENII
eukprot:230703_1